MPRNNPLGEMITVFKKKSTNSKFLGPSCGKMKEFMEKGRTYQTLYANSEGSYSRRVVNVNEKHHLRHLIHCSLWYNEDHFYLTEKDLDKRLFLEELGMKIISISTRFDTPGEVHFCIIWVHFYNYENNKSKVMPLFKVYKKKNLEEAVFLDINLKEYDGWEYYLDHGAPSNSFLCIPRNGEYKFHSDSESLDLIYIYSKATESSECASSFREFTPFYEVVVVSMLSKLKKISAAVMSKIKNFVVVLSDLWKDRGRIFCVLIWYIETYLEMNKSNSSDPNSFDRKFFDYNLMLRNTYSSSSWQSIFVKELKNVNFSVCEMSSLYQCLKAPKKDWDEIFCHFVKIYRLHNSSCQKLLSYVPPGLAILNLLEIIIKILELYKSESQRNKITLEAVKPSTTSDAVSTVSSNTDISSVPDVRLPKNSPIDLEEEKVKVMAIQKLMSNITEIETRSFESVTEKVYEEAKTERGIVGMPTDYVSPLIEVEPNFPGRVYLFSEATLPRVTEKFQMMFQSVTFRFRNQIVYDVIDDKDHVVATLYYPNDISAIGWVRDEALENSAERLEL